MSLASHIARPYALAAFHCAREKETLPQWKAFLQSAAYIVHDETVQRVLANPEILVSQLFDLFQGVLVSQLDIERKNFLQLLAQNRRLFALSEIAEIFIAYYTQLEKLSRVNVVTAVELQADVRHRLANALKKRIQCEVELKCEVDEAILGGAVIHIGDHVIDGSLRGKLGRLLETVCS